MSTKAFNPDINPTPETMSYGPTREQTNRNYQKGDRETAQSEANGNIPRGTYSLFTSFTTSLVLTEWS